MLSALVHAKSSQSEQLLMLSPLAELTFYRALAHSDDYGRIEADPIKWALHVAPGRLTVSSAKRVIKEIVSAGLANTYVIDGTSYIEFQSWFEHQTHYRHDMVLKSRVPNPETRELEPTRTYKQAKDEGLVARRPSNARQIRTDHVSGSKRASDPPAAETPSNKEDHQEQTPETRDSAQIAMGLLHLIKKQEIKESINQFFLPSGEIDIASVSRAAASEERDGLWKIFLAIYPESGRPVTVSAKKHFRDLAKQGLEIDMLKGAMRYRMYCEQKNITDKIYSVQTFLETAKFQEPWINLSTLKPAAGRDFRLDMLDGSATSIDIMTGQPFNETEWRNRLLEITA